MRTLTHDAKESGWLGIYLIKEVPNYIEDYAEDVQQYSDHDLVEIEGNTIKVYDLFTDCLDSRRYSLAHGYVPLDKFIDRRR